MTNVGKCISCHWFSKTKFTGGWCELNPEPVRKIPATRCSHWRCKWCKKKLFEAVHAGCERAFS